MTAQMDRRPFAWPAPGPTYVERPAGDAAAAARPTLARKAMQLIRMLLLRIVGILEAWGQAELKARPTPPRRWGGQGPWPQCLGLGQVPALWVPEAQKGLFFGTLFAPQPSRHRPPPPPEGGAPETPLPRGRSSSACTGRGGPVPARPPRGARPPPLPGRRPHPARPSVSGLTDCPLLSERARHDSDTHTSTPILLCMHFPPIPNLSISFVL